MAKATKRKAFDYTLDFQSIDFRKHPELYAIGKTRDIIFSTDGTFRSFLASHR